MPAGDTTMSPTQRALTFYRGIDATCVVLERWIPHTKIRQDIWGADMLVLHGQKLIAVQVTDGTNHSKRVAKAMNDPDVANWLKGGAGFEVFSESLRGAAGAKKKWKVRITQLGLNGKNKLVRIT